jgi:insertion element IS1 protein InsB
MVSVPVLCPYCHSTEVIKAGKQANGTQRSWCHNEQCARRLVLLYYQDRGRIPEIRRQVVALALNGSGIRDTARVLRISPTTVIAIPKKSRRTAPRQLRVTTLSSFTRPPSPGRRRRRIDEMGSFVDTKATARWLWHALEPHTGRVLAYVVDPRKVAMFLKLQALLAPFGITRYDTAKAGVYQRYLPPEQHRVGKLTMQKIERKHLTLRTRLKR